MQKITIMNLHLGVGGIEKYISSLTKMLGKDYDISLIITYKLMEHPAFSISSKIKITYLIDEGPNKDDIKKCIKRRNLAKLFKEGIKAIRILYLKRTRTIKAIKSIDADFVITTRTYETRLVNKYLKNNKIIKIATDHNYPTNKYKKELIRNLNNYDKLIVVNDEIKNIYKREIGSKVECIHNVLDINSNLKSKLDTKNIISIGRFSKEKGYLDLIDVMSLIVKKDKDVKLTLIGDGEEKEAIKEKIKALNLEDNIKLTGFLNQLEIEKYMLESSVYVMSSITESFGLVLLEAMNYALPCIAFDSASGPRELLQDGIGILIKNRDKEQMAEKILSLLNDKKLLKQYSEKSLKQVKNYTPKNAKEKWGKVLSELTSKSSKRVLFISSTGGHLNELLQLRPLLEKYKSYLITEKTKSTVSLKSKYANVNYLVFGTKEHPFSYIFKFTYNVIKSFVLYLKIRPEVIITTGAHTAVPMCYIGKLFKSKIIFIETFANSKTKTLSGNLVYPIADKFVVQWESMKKLYPNAVVGGWIY